MFGSSANVGSSKFIPYLYDRIKSLITNSVNSQLIADRETVQISTDYLGANEDFSNSAVNFKVLAANEDTTGSWTISVDTETNCTTNQVSNDISITAITTDEASYVVKAVRTSYPTIYKTIQVSKVKDGLGIPSGGTIGQSLTKSSGTDYDVDWETVNSGGVYQNQTTYYLRPYNEGVTLNGNARGNYSTDFQLYRTVATQVASGSHSFLGSGWKNTVSSDYSFCGAGESNAVGGSQSGIVAGDTNTIAVTASNSVIAGGASNTISVPLGFIGGGDSNTVSGYYGCVTGGIGNEAHDYSETVLGLYSTVSTGTSSSNVSGNMVFKVGNGTGTGARNDAFTVNVDGVTTINNILDITPQASAPTAVEGRVYYNSTTHVLYCYDGSTWQALF